MLDNLQWVAWAGETTLIQVRGSSQVWFQAAASVWPVDGILMTISQDDFHGLSQGVLTGITSRCVARVLPILGYWAERNSSRLVWVDFAESFLSKIDPSDEAASGEGLLCDHLAYQAYYLASKAILVLCSQSHVVVTKESQRAAEFACAYVAESLETLSQLVFTEMTQESRQIAKLRSRFSYDLDQAIGTPRDGKDLAQFNESMRHDVANWRIAMNWKESLWKGGSPDWYSEGKKKAAYHRVNGS